VELLAHPDERHVQRHQHVQHLIVAFGLVARVFCPAASHAEVLVRAAPSFLLFEQAGGVAAAACAPPSLADELLSSFVQRQLLEAELDPQLVIVLLTENLGCNRLFYVPVANDVRGIGYQYERAGEVFDDSPGLSLEGIAFLNDLTYALDHPAEFGRELSHELGHRWGSRVRIEHERLPSDVLLGRERQHWSYFLDSGGSPLEGNRFRSVGNGRVRVDAPLADSAFSALDLYLMGVLPAEQVPPFKLYLAEEDQLRDCAGAPLDAASPPQTCAALELDAEGRELGLDAVLRAEGPRSPPALDEARSVDVAVLMLQSGAQAPTARDCRAYTAEVERALRGFSEATGHRLTLHNVSRSDASCVDWPSEPLESDPPELSCALGPRRSPSDRRVVFWLGFSSLALRWWRATPSRHATRRRTEPRSRGTSKAKHQEQPGEHGALHDEDGRQDGVPQRVVLEEQRPQDPELALEPPAPERRDAERQAPSRP
jgi:hypothetical protein